MATKPRKIFTVLLIGGALYALAALVVLLRPGAALSTDKRTVIRISHWQVEAGPREALEAMIERYEELNPDVRVEQIAVPGRAYTRWVRTQLIGEMAPDIIEFSGGNTDIAPRFFDPIGKYVAEPNPYNRGTPLEGMRWRDTFIDGLNTPAAYLERLSDYYAITMCVVTMRLFYNPELLEEITGSREPPRTYVELREIEERIVAYREREGRRVSLYAGSEFTGQMLNERLVSGAGMDLSFRLDRFREQGSRAPQMALEYLRGNWSFRSPVLYAGLENSREAARYMRPGFQQMDRDAATQEFLRGQAVLIFTGTWDATSLKTMAPFEVGVDHVPWPAKSDGTKEGRFYWGPISDGEASTSMPFYLNKQSPHKDEAIDFLRFATSLEGNTLWMEMSGWNPAIRGIELPEELEIFQHKFDGFMMRTSFMRGFGVETREIWQRNMHHLTAANGDVDRFLEVFEQEYPAALRKDVESNVRNIYLSLRRDVPSLMAVATLDRLLGYDEEKKRALKIRESNQSLTEAKLYEAKAVLARGSAIVDPLP